MQPAQAMNQRMRPVIVLVAIVTLALVGVYFQAGKLGLEYLGTEQLSRHNAVIQGTAPDPWAYRLLFEFALEPVLRLADRVGIPLPVPVSFISARVVQNIAILGLAYAYYRRLQLNLPIALIALGAATWSMTHSLFDSDLAFSTYTEIALYAVGALLILSKKYRWLIPLVAVGTLNRETIALLPIMLLLATYERGKGWDREVLLIALVSIAISALEYIGLRVIIGPRPLKLAYGHYPGLDLLAYNLFRSETWAHLAGTLSVFPILAVVGYRKLSKPLQSWLTSFVPVWIILHLIWAVLAETRLLLVPQILIFIPAAFQVAVQWEAVDQRRPAQAHTAVSRDEATNE